MKGSFREERGRNSGPHAGASQTENKRP
jgi:hypothetical protein